MLRCHHEAFDLNPDQHLMNCCISVLLHHMKLLIAAFAVLGMATQTTAQQALARVSKLQGKEVYILSQPVREYETTATVRSSPKITSLLTRGIINESISEKSNQFVNKLIRRANKKGVEFDAIVYSGGKTARAVKFTVPATAENEGIARVDKFQNLDVYVLSEPMTSYAVTASRWGGVKLIPFLTYGWINNSIERDTRTFVKRLTKEEQDLSGVVYSAGKRAVGVKYR